jgi:hypothetical protein
MKVDGQCHCGAIAFEAEVDPGTVSICHCSDCQQLTGTTYRASIQAPAASFRLLRGTPKGYVKTAESGNKRNQVFCGDCGSPLYACAPENPTVYSLRIGALAQRAEMTPNRQIWFGSALPWVGAVPGLPAREKG